MEVTKIVSTPDLRGKTDESLEKEQTKTDEYLEHHSKSVEEETDETIRHYEVLSKAGTLGHRLLEGYKFQAVYRTLRSIHLGSSLVAGEE